MTALLHPSRLTRWCVAGIAAAVLAAPVIGQTPIALHSNSFTPEQDVELGRRAAAEVRQQLPMLDDRTTTSFVQQIGNRLIREVPEEFRQPAFRYTFEVVNLKEINAFALPGGPMFLHRGMIEAASTDGEVAGVMAHELSHVILRHGTVQATKGQKFQLGAIAGQVLGSIIGGRRGDVLAEASNVGLGAYFLKYGREYEREADLLGAQIMARAGYDPRHMANMFRTIEQQGGSRGPEWLSSHPNPGNRHQAILREASMLQVSSSGSDGEIRRVHARLAQLPPAPTSEQVARARQTPGATGTSGTARGVRVDPPAGQWRTYRPGSLLRVSVPANWRQLGGGSLVTYAPEGGYVESGRGQSAFTHGIQIGVTEGDGRSLQQSTEQLLQSFARANPGLRRQGGFARTTIGGRQGLTTTLTNVSEITGEPEAVNVSTVRLNDGSVLFIVGVAPRSEAQTYLRTFSRVRQSLQIADAAPR